MSVNMTLSWKEGFFFFFSVQKNNLGTFTETTCLMLQEGYAYSHNNVKLIMTNTCTNNIKELPDIFSS